MEICKWFTRPSPDSWHIICVRATSTSTHPLRLRWQNKHPVAIVSELTFSRTKRAHTNTQEKKNGFGNKYFSHIHTRTSSYVQYDACINASFSVEKNPELKRNSARKIVVLGVCFVIPQCSKNIRAVCSLLNPSGLSIFGQSGIRYIMLWVTWDDCCLLHSYGKRRSIRTYKTYVTTEVYTYTSTYKKKPRHATCLVRYAHYCTRLSVFQLSPVNTT